jgi:DNA-binding CsgD family transcriptional regulator
LVPADQALFARLAVFVGGCTLADAAVVCNPNEELGSDTLDGIRRLVEHSLLRREDGPDGEPWFAMLETVREFALECLEASGESDIQRRRHAQAMLAFAQHAGQGLSSAASANWMPWIDLQLPNLRAAFAWAIAESDAETALLLSAEISFGYWDQRGRRGEGEAWVAGALALSGATHPTLARARALHVLGFYHAILLSFDSARTLIEEAVSLAREFNDPRQLSRVLSTLSYVLWNEPEAALQVSWESEALARTMGDDWRLAEVLNVAAIIERRARGSTDRCRALFDEAERLFRAMGDRHQLANVLRTRAEADELDGAWQEAHARWQELLSLARELGHPRFEAVALGFLGLHAMRDEHDAPRGITLYAQALRLARDTGQDQLVTGLVSDIVEPTIRIGRAREAARLCAAASAMRERRPGLRAVGIPQVFARRRRTQEVVRETLGEEDFAAAWEEGQAMSEEQAITAALAVADALATPPALPSDAAAQALPARLTTREVEVLRLLASGASNQAMAEQLVLSVKTVERHIANIYAKIDVQNRVEAAAYAHRYGLLERDRPRPT